MCIKFVQGNPYLLNNRFKRVDCKYLQCIYQTLVLLLLFSFDGCAPSSVRYTRPSQREQIIESRKTNKTKKCTKKKVAEKKESFQDHEQKIEKSPDIRKLKKIVSSYLGVCYRYGGTSRRGMDCSGFVWRVFSDLGKKDFPRTSSANLTKMGRPVTRKNAQVGDLIFFKEGSRINHVGIYMGDKKFVHSTTKCGVIYTSVYNKYFSKRYVCIRRVLDYTHSQ